MGLTVWKDSPKGNIRETDVVIAKNYLNEKELDHLNRIVTMYLDYAEMQAKRGIIMYMKDWVSKLDALWQKPLPWTNMRNIIKYRTKTTYQTLTAR